MCPSDQDVLQHVNQARWVDYVEDTRHLAGMRDADGVADGDLERAEIGEARGHVGDARRRHVTFERTAERGGEIRAHAQACRARAIGDLTVGRDRVVDALIDVLAAEGLARGGEHGDLCHAGGDRAVEPGEIRHERGVTRARPPRDAREHLRGVRHLRHPFRADERAHLDRRQIRGAQPVDELDLVGGRHARALVLQPIARADLDDGDAFRCHDGR